VPNKDKELVIYYQYAEPEQYIFVGTVKNYNKLLDIMDIRISSRPFVNWEKVRQLLILMDLLK
jgi:hypothetical protein